jgi:hypothetical protein
MELIAITAIADQPTPGGGHQDSLIFSSIQQAIHLSAKPLVSLLDRVTAIPFALPDSYDSHVIPVFAALRDGDETKK